jgi:ribosomal protein S6--L-glutamate ligase
MSLRIGVLGSADSPYTRQLLLAAQSLGCRADVLAFPQLQAWIGPGKLPAQPSTEGGPIYSHQQLVNVSDQAYPENSLDAILVRTMPLGSLEQVIFRMDCLQVWQSLGAEVINSPRCLETSIDKWLTLHRLVKAGQTRDQALSAFEELGRDVLVKPLFGGEGRGIIRLQDRDLAWRTFSTLQQLGQVLYVQPMIPNFGYDIRVLWIGQQAFSIQRWASHGDYRTNVSQGGVAEVHQLTDQQLELSRQAARSVDGSVVGVDLLPAKDGQLYVLEVNAVPGWKAVSACLKVDIAREMIQYVQQQVANK